jgi:hypothetical protein
MNPDTDGGLAVAAAVEIADGLNRPIRKEQVGLGIVLEPQLADLETILQKGELSICAAGIGGPRHISL